MVYRGSNIVSLPEKFIKKSYDNLQGHRNLLTNYKDNLAKFASSINFYFKFYQYFFNYKQNFIQWIKYIFK